MATVQEVHDFLEWLIGIDMAKSEVVLDLRGLCLDSDRRVALSPPINEEACTPDGKLVFLSGRLREPKL